MRSDGDAIATVLQRKEQAVEQLQTSLERRRRHDKVGQASLSWLAELDAIGQPLFLEEVCDAFEQWVGCGRSRPVRCLRRFKQLQDVPQAILVSY